ncbi:MAG: hypothetical protein RL556_532 [Actinomycetota bacterium]|jgi:hypothetical protein
MANDIDDSKVSAEERSKRRRARQTMNNLLLSLAACGAIVLGLVLIVPRDDSSRIQPVDYISIGKGVAASVPGEPVLLPGLIAKDWWANSARWTSKAKDGVDSWYVGFVGPENQYIGMTQAFQSNPTWLFLFLKDSMPTGTLTIDSRVFTVYETTVKNDAPKSKDYALVTEVGSDQVIIYGTASKSELKKFATLVSEQLTAKYSK